jgi:hypothetical protein
MRNERARNVVDQDVIDATRKSREACAHGGRARFASGHDGTAGVCGPEVGCDVVWVHHNHDAVDERV